VTKKPKLTPTMLQRIAAQFKALSDPSRLRLMSLLFDCELSVGALARLSDLSLANVSKHLQILHAADFVSRRKIGVSVHYSLADERARQLCTLMCNRILDLAGIETSRLAAGG